MRAADRPDAQPFAVPAASGADSVTTTSPEAPARALWMWAAVAGSAIPETEIDQHTWFSDGVIVIVAVPVPSASPGPGTSFAPRRDAVKARTLTGGTNPRWSCPRTAPPVKSLGWT